MGIMEIQTNIKKKVISLWNALRQPSVWKPILFLFLWQATPICRGPFVYYVMQHLRKGPEFLGTIRLINAGASFIGILIYQQYFKSISTRQLIIRSSFLSVPLGI